VFADDRKDRLRFEFAARGGRRMGGHGSREEESELTTVMVAASVAVM
jgi:hypothetical protein